MEKEGFDLGELITTQEEGSVMNLINLKGKKVYDSKGKPITITLLSTDSQTYKACLREHQNKLLNKKQRRGGNDVDIAASEEMTRRARANATVAWSGIKLLGKDLECNAENAYMLYCKVDEVDEQVAEFIADRANFMKAS